MLKKFTLRNYKNFKNEISIDFENIAGYQFNMDCLYEGTIGKMLIYGRNATGKTNLSNYVERMQMITVGSGMRFLAGRSNQFFYELLEKRALLTDLEEFLNVMGIECSLALKELPDGQKELYFVHKQMVPFYENASSGTLALFDLYRRLIVKIGGSSFVYLDEFDAFYHYEMAEKVIGFFKRKYPKCQMIMTSHNTNLMTNRIMRPDCLLILSSRGTLTSLCNATERELREGHNLEKMYISGEFERYE